MKRILKDYQALPYSRRAERIHEDDGSSYWVAWIHELTTATICNSAKH